MATPKIRNQVSATYAIDNLNDGNRSCDITAEIGVKGTSVTHISKGTVTDRQKQPLADFTKYGSLQCNVYVDDNGVEVFTAIQNFIDTVYSEIETILSEKEI